MKKNNKFIYLIFALIIIYLLISYFYIIPNYKNNLKIFNIISWLVISFISLLLLNKSHEKRKTNKDVLQIVFIISISFFVLYFVLGIFIGFVKNPLNVGLSNALKNILVYGLVIIFEEITRYLISNNSKKSLGKFLIILVIFTGVEIIYSSSVADYTTNMGLFKYISMTLFPSLAKNILLTFICFNVSYLPSVIYRLLMELYIYVLPIFPNTGEYIDAIVLFLIPFITMYFISNVIYHNDSRSRIERKRTSSRFGLAIFAGFILVSIALISGLFKYQSIAIVSNSMVPCFKRGDTVIFEHVSQDLNNVNVGDILVYKKDSIYVTHRIIEINDKGIITKGDANESPDIDIVSKNQIVGIERLIIPYLGYPSVWVQEFLIKK